MVATLRRNPSSPNRLHDKNSNWHVASQIQKVEKGASLLAVIAVIKAEMEAEAAKDEYRRRMNADEPVFADAAPAFADDGGYDSDGYDLNTYNGLGWTSHCDMCHDGACPYCCDDCHGA